MTDEQKNRGTAQDDAPREGQESLLFYRDPVAISSVLHAAWRIKPGNQAFAQHTNAVPVMVGEFAATCRDYPIVFAANDDAPLALLGLERDNLFVRDGNWKQDCYVPAYVRRYPFVFMQTTQPDGFALSVDAGSPQVVKTGNEGVALFTDGKPSEMVETALQFCGAFTAEHTATQEFVKAVREQGLLVDRHADITLPGGRKLGLHGFRVIDADKFAALPDAVVLEWHRRHWLALVHFHLASLERFATLLSMQGAAEPAAQATSPTLQREQE